MTEDDVERLGHWSRNSTMTRRYDNAAGTSERYARETLMKAFRTGWRPAKDGCLPTRPSFEKNPCKAVQEFVPALLPPGALEPGPCGLAYHQRSGNGKSCGKKNGIKRNPCKVVQEFVPVPLPSGALEQVPAESVYHQRRMCHHKTISGSGVSVWGRVEQMKNRPRTHGLNQIQV